MSGETTDGGAAPTGGKKDAGSALSRVADALVALAPVLRTAGDRDPLALADPRILADAVQSERPQAAMHRSHVDAYMANPVRITPANDIRHSEPTADIWSKLANAFLQETRETLEDGAKEAKTPARQGYPNATLVCFGVTGVDELLEIFTRGNAKDILIFDSRIERLLSAFAFGDPFALRDAVSARGGLITLIHNSTPTSAVALLVSVLRDRNWRNIWGLWLYPGLYARTLEDTIKAFWNARFEILSYNGFLPDEMRMAVNAVTNRFIYSQGTMTLDACRDLIRRDGRPLLLVGSGPSLDRYMDTIAHQRDRFLLASCGTSIEPLLRRGLSPDFHVEIENVNHIAAHLRQTSGVAALNETILIGPWSLAPDVGAIFKRRVFFARSGDAYNAAYDASEEWLALSGGGVSAGALAIFAELGIERIGLVGIDFGAENPDKHHAAGTRYDAHPKETGSFASPTRIMLEGRAGRLIYSNATLLHMRMNFERVAAEYRDTMNLRNLGDGADIQYAARGAFDDWLAESAQSTASEKEPWRSRNLADQIVWGAALFSYHDRLEAICAEAQKLFLIAKAQIETCGVDLDALWDLAEEGRENGADSATPVPREMQAARLIYKISVQKTLHAARVLRERHPDDRSGEMARLERETLLTALHCGLRMNDCVGWFCAPETYRAAVDSATLDPQDLFDKVPLSFRRQLEAMRFIDLAYAFERRLDGRKTVSYAVERSAFSFSVVHEGGLRAWYLLSRLEYPGLSFQESIDAFGRKLDDRTLEPLEAINLLAVFAYIGFLLHRPSSGLQEKLDAIAEMLAETDLEVEERRAFIGTTAVAGYFHPWLSFERQAPVMSEKRKGALIFEYLNYESVKLLSELAREATDEDDFERRILQGEWRFDVYPYWLGVLRRDWPRFVGNDGS